jgi:hypothetical protein
MQTICAPTGVYGARANWGPEDRHVEVPPDNLRLMKFGRAIFIGIATHLGNHSYQAVHIYQVLLRLSFRVDRNRKESLFFLASHSDELQPISELCHVFQAKISCRQCATICVPSPIGFSIIPP